MMRVHRERMSHIGEIRTASQKPPALACEFRHVVMDRCTPVEDFGALACQPLPQIAHAPKRRDLTQLVGADRDGVEEFLDFGQTGRRGDHCAHAVAGQAVRLGKGIKLDECLGPVGIVKEVVPRAGAGIEIAVGFIDDKGKTALFGQAVERMCEVGGIFHAARIVGGNEHDGAGAGRDERRRVIRIGQKFRARRQRDSAHAQCLGGRGHGGGLAYIDERAMGRECHPVQPAPRLHDRGRKGAGGARRIDHVRPPGRVRHIAGPYPTERKSTYPG